MNLRQVSLAVFGALGIFSVSVQAEPAAVAPAPVAVRAEPAAATQTAAVREAARKAVVSNPEVQAAWNAFLAADAAQDVARGGYLPQLQASAGVGRERLRRPGQGTERYNTRGAELSLSQMVYDGFYTSSEVERLAYERLGRYFDLLDAAEGAAHEALRAYADVMRYRYLVGLAKENYVEHKVVYQQIEERTAAGVGRRVDFELATGRLALAESNLLTELTNLHDVSARYQRIVGERPLEEQPRLPETLAAGLVPASAEEVLRQGFSTNPALNAAIESVRSGQAQLAAWRSAHHPRVDLRGRQSHLHNRDGVSGNTRETVVELVLSYNLYRGGADQARIRQAADELNVARDLREKACRDLRQNLSIAYNDARRLDEQLVYLDQHQLSIGKARQAYRSQFEIGQRTLLDLLDNENEFFQARRAYVNAEFDKYVAEARTLAGMGRLMQALGVVREDLPQLQDLERSREETDLSELCPPEDVAQLEIDKEALFAEVLREAGR